MPGRPDPTADVGVRPREAFAPAKINLFLHVGPVGEDGYHPIASLMVFADVGDSVRLRDAEAIGFGVEGPFGEGLGEGADNLVVLARDRLLARLAQAPAPFHLSLEKQLPIAAGLGGGSADAAATLALIRARLVAAGLAAPTADTLLSLARELGADVAACLGSESVIATGRGDVLAPAPPMPALDAVLINPRAPSPTGAVYRAFDATASAAKADMPEFPRAFDSVGAVAAFLRGARNDLQAPGVALQPRIGEVLAALEGEPEPLLTRMSGSGATCFSLCADADEARRLADRLAARHPSWWVRGCRLAVHTNRP